jgi:16S rRNA C967 or C1407 C5-methylase (RsmB/RsmF family)
VVDLAEGILGVVEAVDIVFWPVAMDFKKGDGELVATLLNGAVRTSEQEEMARLLDAPCSGVGNWQCQPYARWTTTPQDVVELGGIQKSLLKTVASAVKPGGKLVYAVCSLTRAETTEVVQAFNEQMTGFLPLRTPDPFASQRRESETHWFRPEDRPGNGMFVALWRRA